MVIVNVYSVFLYLQVSSHFLTFDTQVVLFILFLFSFWSLGVFLGGLIFQCSYHYGTDSGDLL